MRPVIAIALGLLCAPLLCAQEPAAISVPEFHAASFGGSIAAFTAAPPDVVLTGKQSDSRRGRLWIRNAGTGLLIAGEVQGGPPSFPRDQSSLLARDHIEIWLAAGADPIFPPIGWGNQFGQTQLPNGRASCANPDSEQGNSMFEATSTKSLHECREWVVKQEAYRRYFSRLFLRQWIVAPGFSVESFATPAYQQIVSHYADLYNGSIDDEAPELLKPRGALKSWFTPSPKGYTFEVLIPYSSFPPLPSLEVSDLRLLVSVVSTAAPHSKSAAVSSSSPSRVEPDADSFNHLVLDPPRVFHMTPCNMPLSGRDLYGTSRDAWFIPRSAQPNAFQSDAFLIVNEAGGYWYDPTGLSPIVHPVHDFWAAAGPNEWVCGPQLTHTKNGHSTTFDEWIESDGLATRALPNGDLLVKSGPLVDVVSQFGAGECGNCSYTSLQIFRITPEEQIDRVLNLGDKLMGVPPLPVAEDFTIAPDWSQVTDFQESVDDNGNPGPWSSTTYCLQDSRYAECGKQDNVTPPQSPLLREEQ